MLGVGLVLLYFGLAALAAAIVMQSDRYVVRRSATVDADAKKLFARINDPGVWAPWGGKGRAEIVESRPDELAVLRLEAGNLGKAETFVSFALRPEGGKTIVECSMSGRNSYVDKARNIFWAREKTLGPRIEKALADLAASVS